MFGLYCVLAWISLIQASTMKIGVIISDSTPPYLISASEAISKSSSKFSSQIVPSDLLFETSELDLSDFIAILDISQSSIISTLLIRALEPLNLPYLCFSHCPHSSYPFIFRMLPSCSDILLSIQSSLAYLSWTDFTVFYDSSECSTEIMQGLAWKTKYYMSADSYVDILLTRLVKTSGIKLWLILTSEEIAASIESHLIENKMMKKGTGILSGPIGSVGMSYPGELLLTLEGFENINSTAGFYSNILSSVLDQAYKIMQGQAEDSLLVGLESLLRGKTVSFSIYNTLADSSQNEVISMDCTTDCIITRLDDIIYIANTTDPPMNSKTEIPMSLTGGITDPTNKFQISNQNMMNGARIAIDSFNTGESLPSFTFTYTNVTCYTSSIEFNSTCYDEFSDRFGLFHLSAHSSKYTENLEAYMHDSKFTLIGTTDGESLEDKNLYPTYISVGIPFKYIMNALLQVTSFLGFNDIAVISDQTADNLDFTVHLWEYALRYNLNVLNTPNNYLVNITIDKLLNNSDSVLQAVIDSGARIIVVACSDVTLIDIMDKFVDMGMEKGDVFFATKSLTFEKIVNLTDPTFAKREPLVSGTFKLSPTSAYGELGASIKEKALELYGSFSVRTCDYYDAFILGAYGIESLINTGKDYEVDANILSAARKAKFTGCNGFISIVDYANLRDSSLYEMYQIQNINGNWTYDKVAEYTPTGTTVFTINEPIYWTANGRPSSIRVKVWDCPYNPKFYKMFTPGRVIVAIVCAVVSCFTIVNTMYIWKKFWKLEYPLMTEKKEISMQDTALMLTVFLELFQIAAMGPDILNLSGLLAYLASSLTYSLDDLISLKNGVFWYILLSVMLCCSYWLLLCIVWIFGLHERFYGNYLFRLFGWSIINLMPIIGNLLFIPIISTLINVFLCDHAIDDSYSSSILDKDCFQMCWTKQHISYAAPCGIFILAYQPLAVYFRPLWQEQLPLLHIKTSPRYLMLKSVYQVTLIVLNKTLKRYSAEAHDIVYLLLIFAYLAFLTKAKAYNYERLNMWQILGIGSIMWLGVICTIFNYAYQNQTALVIVLFFGWIFIGIFGLLLQRKKYPSMLMKKDPKQIDRMFRWMCGLETDIEIFNSVKYEMGQAELEQVELGSKNNLIVSSK